MDVINCGSHRRGPSVTRRTKIIIVIIVVTGTRFHFQRDEEKFIIEYNTYKYIYKYSMDNLETVLNQLKLMSQFII